jgi:uncharacterized membrane protein YidH (DUF202 family)
MKTRPSTESRIWSDLKRLVGYFENDEAARHRQNVIYLKTGLANHELLDLTTALAIIRTIEAEKRTHLAELRTGIGILTIPMSLLAILVATSSYYSVQEVLGFIIGLSMGILVLAAIGMYLVIRSLTRIRHDEQLKDNSSLHTEKIVEDWTKANGL